MGTKRCHRSASELWLPDVFGDLTILEQLVASGSFTQMLPRSLAHCSMLLDLAQWSNSFLLVLLILTSLGMSHLAFVDLATNHFKGALLPAGN